jgi:hypothetical protein
MCEKLTDDKVQAGFHRPESVDSLFHSQIVWYLPVVPLPVMPKLECKFQRRRIRCTYAILDGAEKSKDKRSGDGYEMTFSATPFLKKYIRLERTREHVGLKGKDRDAVKNGVCLLKDTLCTLQQLKLTISVRMWQYADVWRASTNEEEAERNNNVGPHGDDEPHVTESKGSADIL